MLKFSRKKLLFPFLLPILILGIFLFARAYESEPTHTALAKKSAEIYNQYGTGNLTGQEILWIQEGAKKEDTPPRWINHFYDPTTSQGWTAEKMGRVPVSVVRAISSIGLSQADAVSSLNWAHNQGLQERYSYYEGNRTFEKAIYDYVNGNKKEAYKSLGHILHLVEDMAVPAHTRQDTHVDIWGTGDSGEPYEKWAGKNTDLSHLNNLNPKQENSSCSNLDDCLIRLAKYSNENFFSEDTINDKNYKKPKNIKEIVNINEIIFYGKDDKDNEYSLAIFDRNKNIYTLQRSYIHSSYWRLLSKQAVLAGAEVIKIFHQEAEKAIQDKNLIKEPPQKSPLNKMMTGLFGIAAPNSNSPIFSLFGFVSQTKDFFSSIGSKIKSLSSSLLNVVGIEDGQNINFPEQGIVIDQVALNNLANQQQNEGQVESNQIISTKPEFNVQQDNNSAQNGETGVNQQTDNQQQNNQNNNESSENQNQSNEQSGDNGDQNEEISDEFSTSSNNNNESNNLPPGSSIGTSRGGTQTNENADSNATSTPAVDTMSPQTYATSTLFFNNETIATSTAIFEFSSSEANSTFECQLDNASSTLCVSPVQYNNLANGSHIFSVKAIDQANNQDQTPEVFNWIVDVPAPTIADHVVISEVATNGSGGANDEWIELYNPTAAAVDLFGWSIQYRGSKAENFERKNFNATSTIPAQGFFLITHSSYSGGVPRDLEYNNSQFQLSHIGGNIFLVNNQTTLTSATSTSIIDKLSYGSGAYLFPEGNVFSQAPSSTESVERKANADSTAESLATGNDKWQGNNYDSNNNSQDFVLQTSPTPQSSQSLTEPRSSFPLLSTDAPWPMFQGNEKHTGRANSDLPTSTTTPQVLFEFDNPSITFKTPPVIGQNKLFIGASDGIRAFDLNGYQLWFYPSESGYGSPIAIANNNTIYARIDGKGLYAFSYDGSLKWRYSFAGNSYNSSPNIDKNGIIYTIGLGKVYAIYPDGKIKWVFDIADLGRSFNLEIGSPVIDNARERVYINIEDYLYTLSFNGDLVWEFQNSLGTGLLTKRFGTPIIDENGIIYVAAKGDFPSGGFYALYPDGSVKWFNDVALASSSAISPAIGANGIIYFTASKYISGMWQKIYALDLHTGIEKWSALFTFDNVISSPITAGENVYFPFGARLYAYDKNGNMLWYWPEIGSGFDNGFGAADNDGNLYFAIEGKIYKMGN